jgi:hypothetical protein
MDVATPRFDEDKDDAGGSAAAAAHGRTTIRTIADSRTHAMV